MEFIRHHNQADHTSFLRLWICEVASSKLAGKARKAQASIQLKQDQQHENFS